MAGASALRLERPGDARTFQEIAGPVLAAREAENNLTIGLTANLVAGRSYGPKNYFGIVRDGDRVVGVALRAGLYLIVTPGTTVDALRLLVEDAAIASADAPGVVGPKELALKAADLWTAKTGQRAILQVQERIYRLTRVVQPRPVRGRMRPARPTDLDVLAAWFQAFTREAQPYYNDSVEVSRSVAERWISSGGLRVWEDGGEAVSMAGASGPTPHGMRIGAVFTPPEHRKRGYASALVATLSQEQLDAGKQFCFLFTDLANPTSNKIYMHIGYEPVIDVDQYAFE